MKSLAILSNTVCCRLFNFLLFNPKLRVKKQLLFLLAFLFFAFNVNAQTFNGATGALPDNSCNSNHEFSATVSGVGILGNLNIFDEVVINITHTFTGDLDITLIAPDGVTSVLLSSDNGGNGDNYTDTHFRADASSTITSGSAPFTGNFLPEGSLSSFNGVNADGDWILQVCDDAGDDDGTLDSWNIKFIPNPNPPVQNPDLDPGACDDFKVILVLDESGSIDPGVDGTAGGSADYGPDVIAAAKSMVNGLVDSGAELAVVEFASLASNSNINGSTDFQEVNLAYKTAFDTYIDVNYDPGNGTVTQGGWTNWQDALQKVLDLDTADLILFVTDGNPTAVVNPGGACPSSCDAATNTPGSCTSCNIATSLPPAIANADVVKSEGAHMFVLGVGGNINESNIIEISGFDKDLCPEGDAVCQAANPTDPPFNQADYALIPFSELEQCLTQLATMSCNTDIKIEKTVGLGHDDCSGAGELVTAPNGTDITYCFEVENTGEGVMDFVQFQDSNLGINFMTLAQFTSGVSVTSGSWPLDPNEVISFYINSSISGAVINTASITGEVLGQDPVSDDDTAEVQLPDTTPFNCEAAFYQVISGRLKIFDPLTSTYTNVGPDHDNINAMGYNIQDNYLYGLDRSDDKTLIQLDANGVKTDVGVITGGPFNPTAGYYAADFDGFREFIYVS